ncbi:aa3-type cytochrome c oxidase subunit IV [Hyphomicrobium sp.]|nr:aa3-type cytochrome c oxidase subunit IV [Hyphomicrobium sp.]HEX2842735.1 aa3-type cytochrome c oxidase subunit IV [Hyphomicrobium sp.]
MATQNLSADPDFESHVQTYHSFLRGAASFIALAAVILILMAYFLL